MIYVLYWSICWLLSLAFIARASEEIEVVDIIATGAFAPLALCGFCVATVFYFSTINFDAVVWRGSSSGIGGSFKFKTEEKGQRFPITIIGGVNNHGWPASQVTIIGSGGDATGSSGTRTAGEAGCEPIKNGEEK